MAGPCPLPVRVYEPVEKSQAPAPRDQHALPGGQRGRNVPLPLRRAPGSLFTACRPSPPGCWGFFGKNGSSYAFCQLRAPVTLIVGSVQ